MPFDSRSLLSWLTLAQDSVQHPATAHVRALPAAAVAQNLLVVAASVLQGVGEDRQVRERSHLVDGSRQGYHSACKPVRFQGEGPERVAKHIPEQPSHLSFCLAKCFEVLRPSVPPQRPIALDAG